MKNIIVTGGAGYIGSHTCKYLYKMGYNPITIDNLSTGYKSFVKWGNLEECDVRDFEKVKLVLRKYKPLAIIHFAAFSQVGESVKNPYKYYHNNVLGTANLLQAMIEEDIKSIIFSSTCAVYGNPLEIPIKESSATNPINPYGKTKLTCENILKDFEISHNLKYVSLRYFNACGADKDALIGERHEPETHLIPLAINSAINKDSPPLKVFGNDYDTKDGTCIRDYIHVDDLAIAHIKAMEYIVSKRKSEIFNLGTGSGFSVNDIIKTVEKVTNKAVNKIIDKRRVGDSAILIADNNKIKELINWSPQFNDINFIIETAYKWTLQNQNLST